MNSEELEVSLRTEFESYLKSVLAEMRQEATIFQSTIQGEFDKHKAQFDEAFENFSARFDADRVFDEGFRGSVAEHLRLARDEGARITANAMAEAEKMEQAAAPVAPVAASYDGIRDAVNDISSKDSQSAILKSLVQHAGQFAPRGAFFIIKNEHFVGWKVFDANGETADTAVRDIHFPTDSDSILSAAASSLSTVDGSVGARSDDSTFLEPLQFGQPDRMYAIPLVARGRGVAVLYADYGTDGVSVNREALETLVRVAGLTVEMLASAHAAKVENRTVGAPDFEDAPHEHAPAAPHEARPQFEDTMREMPADVPVADESAPAAFGESVSFESGFQREAAQDQVFEAQPSDEVSLAAEEYVADAPEVAEAPEPVSEARQAEETAFGGHEVRAIEPVETAIEPVQETEQADAFVFDSGDQMQPAAFEGSPFDKAVEELEPAKAAEEYEPAAAVSGSAFSPAVETAVEAPMAAAPQARMSDRPVDLPIQVPDDERRIHNDARRFARLLVSEIRLYNEKKVIEGREAQDLYDRLREAIDRSREMYDKRVQPPVAAKFDYFHYELVNSLAEGDAQRLGSSYPGSAV